MRRYALSRLAAQDLNQIDDYLSERFGHVVAEEATERLVRTFELLASQPGIGNTRPEWSEEDVLFFPVPGTPSVVIYRDTRPLQIVRIWNGRQDPRLLDSGSE